MFSHVIKCEHVRQVRAQGADQGFAKEDGRQAHPLENGNLPSLVEHLYFLFPGRYPRALVPAQLKKPWFLFGHFQLRHHCKRLQQGAFHPLVGRGGAISRQVGCTGLLVGDIIGQLIVDFKEGIHGSIGNDRYQFGEAARQILGEYADVFATQFIQRRNSRLLVILLNQFELLGIFQGVNPELVEL